MLVYEANGGKERGLDQCTLCISYMQIIREFLSVCDTLEPSHYCTTAMGSSIRLYALIITVMTDVD